MMSTSKRSYRAIVGVCALTLLLTLCACASSGESDSNTDTSGELAADESLEVSDLSLEADEASTNATDETSDETETSTSTVDAAYAQLNISEDYRASFVHGEKTAEYQKYIMIHDTEGSGDPASVVQSWDASGNLVAAHFVIGKDGSIVQCVPLDSIAHHAGYGDAGHNASFGVEDESRDDKLGTTPIGSWAPDYGMNSYSIGIELVHIGGEGDYPAEQLEALDNLIAYIDAYYGFESQITDHKAWRTGNSDTSAEFATYLANYQSYRTHDGA